jgi:hypothetical protein
MWSIWRTSLTTTLLNRLYTSYFIIGTLCSTGSYINSQFSVSGSSTDLVSEIALKFILRVGEKSALMQPYLHDEVVLERGLRLKQCRPSVNAFILQQCSGLPVTFVRTRSEASSRIQLNGLHSHSRCRLHLDIYRIDLFPTASELRWCTMTCTALL